jgi:diguanylate cyclase (GGDEF)-like protein/PAS domain S-box-containing protein
MERVERQLKVQPFMWAIITLGFSACLATLTSLDFNRLNATFLILAVIALAVGSRWTLQTPYLESAITISDTIVFFCMLLYGGEAAIILATAESYCISLRLNKTVISRAYNTAAMACSSFATVALLRYLFGDITAIVYQPFSENFVALISVMALTQYAFNSTLIALCIALKNNQSFLEVWKKNYLYASVTFFASASAAGFVAKLSTSLSSLYALFAVIPIVAIVYFTYWSYLKQVEAKTQQVEQAKRHVAQLQESESRFRSAFDYAAIGMALVDANGRWLEVNRSLCEITGYSEHELLESDFQSITHPDDLSNVMIQFRQILEGRLTSSHLEKRFVHKRGYNVWVHWSISRAGDRDAQSLIFQLQDITDRKHTEEQLIYDAFHDGLTGLPNRALFLDHLKLAIERNKRNESRRFAVLFLDFDRFKIINDSLGHTIGDQLLIVFSRRLESCLRPGDTIARLGGDEFTVLLDDISNNNEVIEIADRIQRSLEHPFKLGRHEIFTTVSIGIANSSLSYEDADEMLRDADTAMYRAKARGTSCQEVFDKAMHAQVINRLQIETDLRHAIERNEFLIHYQPIIELDTGHLSGFEALLRWKHPNQGFISPDAFIPVAEETGLIMQIGSWALREACRQMREWQLKYPQAFPMQMSVNLSGKQFMQPDLIEQIKTVLRLTKLDAKCLKLEITESVVMDNVEATTAVLKQIRALGIELSVDDFGTGYSSLSYLHRFPVSTLKVDRSFVTRMTSNSDNKEIVRTIVTLAHTLGMNIIAEGVETEEQLADLTALKCKYGQGYLFSRPVESKAASIFIKRKCQDNISFKHPIILNNESDINVDNRLLM